LTFQGWVNDGEASFSDFNGTYRQRESDDWEHAITNAMIEGSFVDKRAMAGAYLLEAPGPESTLKSASGVFLVEGALENRLDIVELQSLDRAGIVIDPVNGTVASG